MNKAKDSYEKGSHDHENLFIIFAEQSKFTVFLSLYTDSCWL